MDESRGSDSLVDGVERSGLNRKAEEEITFGSVESITNTWTMLVDEVDSGENNCMRAMKVPSSTKKRGRAGPWARRNCCSCLMKGWMSIQLRAVEAGSPC